MKLTNRIKGLFSKTTKAPSLSPYTIQHERLDEFILGDMRSDSRRFEESLTRPVMIEHDDGSQETYEPVSDLRSDLFFAHNTGTDAVGMKDRDEVRPSAQLNAEIMRHFIHHEDFLATRPMTRNDPVASALSTMAAQETLDEELRTSLKEQAEKTNQAATEEERIRQQEELLEELRQKAKEALENGTGVPDELKEQIKGAVKGKYDARDKLEDIVNSDGFPGPGTSGEVVAQTAAKAAEAGKDLVEVYASLPGIGVGAGQRVQPEHAIELAMKWRHAPNLKRMADMIGRFERDFRYKRSHRVVGGSDIIVGVETGNDIQKILPHELASFAHPTLKRKFYRDFAGKQLLQYEMIGHAEAGKGPIIICIDASGSMSGGRNEWARAVAMAVCSVAHREKRPLYAIEFASVVTGEWEFPVKAGIDPDVATDFAMSFNGGGTDITEALQRAEQILATRPAFSTADILLITDGSDYMQEDDIEIRDRLRERGVRIQGVTIGMESTPYTDEICDETVAVYELTKTSSATDKIVTGLT